MIGPGEEKLAENSLWSATCAPGWSARLQGDTTADFAVIGGGFTGLSAALRLAEAGARVALIEARTPGWGASGRNGGQVIPGLKARGATDERAAKSEAASVAAVESLFRQIERLGIDCDARRGGWIHAARSARTLDALCAKSETEAGRRAGLRLLDAGETARRLGTEAFLGGLLDPRAGVVHPLKLAAGLARAASSAGAAIWCDTEAKRIAGRPGDMIVETTGGTVRCRAVLVGPNGYVDDLLPEVRRAVVPVISVQVASEPLPPDLRPAVMPDSVAASDIRRLTTYFRCDAEGRFVFGGRGSFRAAENRGLFEELRREAERLFPQLRDRVRWRFAWGGRVAMTTDGIPAFCAPRPGVLAAFGYNGRGVALSNWTGGELAARALGEVETEELLPLAPARRYALHGLSPLGVALAVRAYRLMDRFGI